MGHQRLGAIPTTRKWEAVVAKVAASGEGPRAASDLNEAVPEIAAEVLDAAEAALDRAIDDPGLCFTFYLLTQVVLAAREDEDLARLDRFGIHLTETSSLFDLTVEVQGAIDEHVSGHGGATDLGEMAQKAAGEALSELAGPRALTLFGSGRDELRDALKELSTKAGFARLGQRFFGQFMARFLNFYLSRITAGQVGGPRLQQAGDLNRFDDAVRTHCHQSALIVHDFCGEWYSKTEFVEGIGPDNASRFVAVAVRKLQAELRRQGEGR